MSEVKVIGHHSSTFDTRIKLVSEFAAVAVFVLHCFPKDGATPEPLAIDLEDCHTPHEVLEYRARLHLSDAVWNKMSAESIEKGEKLFRLLAEKAEGVLVQAGYNFTVSRITRAGSHPYELTEYFEDICENPLEGNMIDLRGGDIFDFETIVL